MVMTAHLGAALTNQRPEHKCGAEQFCPGCKNIGERNRIRRFNWNCVVRPGWTQENFQFLCLPRTVGGGVCFFGSWDTRSKSTKPPCQATFTNKRCFNDYSGGCKKSLGCDVLVPPLKHTHFSVKQFFSRSSQSLQQQEQTQKQKLDTGSSASTSVLLTETQGCQDREIECTYNLPGVKK